MTNFYDSAQRSIMAFLRDRLSVDVLAPEHDLIESGILDSLMIVELVLYLEQTFKVALSLEDLEVENFATVARMATFVTARVSRSPTDNVEDLPRRSSVA
jgi:acyl carrier protein